jgi:hypothetical protein
MNSGAPRTALGAANANAMQKYAAKPSGRIQVKLNHTMKDKENFPLLFDSDDDLDRSLQAAGPERTFGEDSREMQPSMYSGLPNPFLDSDDEYEEYEDLANGRWRGNREARAEEEPYSDQDSSSFKFVFPTLPTIWTKLDPSPPTKVTSRGRSDQPKILSTTLQMPMISGAKFVSNLRPSV